MRWTLRLVAMIVALGATPFVAGSPAGAGSTAAATLPGICWAVALLSSLEQCEATRSGIGGDCLRDPFLPDARNSYAYTQIDQGITRDRSIELNTRRDRRKGR
jgi:hypothetical protein